MNGFLNILKPPGMTSHDVVDCLRHILKIRKIGHLGTLDPGAAGVLPIAVEKATKLIEYLEIDEKGYRVEMTLGIVTDTYDSFGKVTQKRNLEDLDFSSLVKIARSFEGTIVQKPPIASSVRVKGKHLYEYHRSGIPVSLPGREVRIKSIEILEFEPPLLILDVLCGPGAYMRSLCKDMGDALGCGAHMSFLVRFKSGDFILDDALTLDEIEGLQSGGKLRDAFISPSQALARLPRIALDDRMAGMIQRGMTIGGFPDNMGEGKILRLESQSNLIAIGKVVGEDPPKIRPLKVLI